MKRKTWNRLKSHSNMSEHDEDILIEQFDNEDVLELPINSLQVRLKYRTLFQEWTL